MLASAMLRIVYASFRLCLLLVVVTISCLGGILALTLPQSNIVFEHARHCAFVPMCDGGTETIVISTAGLDIQTSFVMIFGSACGA
jgi:hypothetical protein